MPEDEEEEVLDFGKKKKGTKKKKEGAEKKESAEGGDEGGTQSKEVVMQGVGEFERGEIYEYAKLLTRLHSLVEEKNPLLGVSQKYVMKPPQVVRVGSKKVAWVNFAEICGLMNRGTEHLQQYVLAEFGTDGNMAGDGQLILKGRFMNKHAESILRKYIKEFVTCAMCRSANTDLKRDSSTRLWVVDCQNCGATRTPATIKTGFHSVSRADRKKAKNATTTQIKA